MVFLIAGQDSAGILMFAARWRRSRSLWTLTLKPIAVSDDAFSFPDMKKFCLALLVSSFVLAACERHPASQLQEGSDQKEGKPQSSQSTPPASSGTPKSFFPHNS